MTLRWLAIWAALTAAVAAALPAVACTGSSTRLPANQCAAWVAWYDGAGMANGTCCVATRTDPCACVGNNPGYPHPVCNVGGKTVINLWVRSLADCNLAASPQPPPNLHHACRRRPPSPPSPPAPPHMPLTPPAHRPLATLCRPHPTPDLCAHTHPAYPPPRRRAQGAAAVRAAGQHRQRDRRLPGPTFLPCGDQRPRGPRAACPIIGGRRLAQAQQPLPGREPSVRPAARAAELRGTLLPARPPGRREESLRVPVAGGCDGHMQEVRRLGLRSHH